MNVHIALDMAPYLLVWRHLPWVKLGACNLNSPLVLQNVRQKLYDEITKINQDRDWSFILRQIGEAHGIAGCTPASHSYMRPANSFNDVQHI